MANEGQVSIAIAAQKGGQVNRSYSFPVSIAGTYMDQGTQGVGTGWAPLNFSNVPQMFSIANLDAANYIQLALDGAGAHIFAMIPAGEATTVLMDPSMSSIYAKANTATVFVEIVAVGP